MYVTHVSTRETEAVGGITELLMSKLFTILLGIGVKLFG